ncbi:MAG: hypothetical protein ACK4HE_07560 [Chitinophagaceae bacterium]
MKNQYFGDVGDFGKFGLLKHMISPALRVGINWYLTKNDSKSDGRHVEYLYKSEFQQTDPELCSFLHHCIENDLRNVEALSLFAPMANMTTYNAILDVSDYKALSPEGRAKRISKRAQWFQESLQKLESCELIFCDPDNGIAPSSVKNTQSDSVKYVLVEEIKTMLQNGHSLVIYNHRDRSTETDYLKRIESVFNTVNTLNNLSLRIARFSRYSVRDYIFFIQATHLKSIENGLNRLFEHDGWSRHFNYLH